jgi:hypothetical protein
MILGKTYLGNTEIQKAYLGSNVVYEVVAGTEIATWDDAAANASATEINGLHFVSITEGWRYGIRAAIASVDSGTTTAQLGSYCVEVKATSTFAAYAAYYLPVTSGKSYTFSFYGKRGAGTDQYWRTNSGVTIPSGDIDITTTSWEKYEYSFVANASVVNILFYVLGNGSIDDTLYIDNISLLEL